jgi:hypothetical protein
LYFEADDLQAAYEQALQHDMPRAWRNALDKGYDLLMASDAIRVEFNGFGAIALAYIPSQREQGVTYAVNGHCDCEAGQRGKPCAHRAAKRLLSIASEQAAARQVTTLAQARRLTAEEITGVTYEQAMRNMAELFAD